MKQLFAPIIETTVTARDEYLKDNASLLVPGYVQQNISWVIGGFLYPITRLYHKHTSILTGEPVDPSELFHTTHRHNATIEKMQYVLSYMSSIDTSGKYISLMDELYATLQDDICPKISDVLYVDHMHMYTQISLNLYMSIICVMVVIDIFHNTNTVADMVDTITSEKLSTE